MSRHVPEEERRIKKTFTLSPEAIEKLEKVPINMRSWYVDQAIKKTNVEIKVESI